jgi:hypothetical protein
VSAVWHPPRKPQPHEPHNQPNNGQQPLPRDTRSSIRATRGSQTDRRAAHARIRPRAIATEPGLLPNTSPITKTQNYWNLADRRQHFPFQTKPAVPGLDRWAAGRDRTAASCWHPDHQSHVPESQTACFDCLLSGGCDQTERVVALSRAPACAHPSKVDGSGLPPAWSTPILDRVGYAAACRSLLSRVDCAWSERRQRF